MMSCCSLAEPHLASRISDSVYSNAMGAHDSRLTLAACVSGTIPNRGVRALVALWWLTTSGCVGERASDEPMSEASDASTVDSALSDFHGPGDITFDSDTELTGLTDITTDGTVAMGGPLAECADQYQGFETCCLLDSSSETWTFSPLPCPGASQCSPKVDCPAGFLETSDGSGGCSCHSPLAGTCREDSPIYVVNDAGCPDDLSPIIDPPRTIRCPSVWPTGGRFTCTNCPCERRASDIAIVEPIDCPEDKDQEGCPCSGAQCCLSGGRGLVCSNSQWVLFHDGPCVPGSGEPFPGYCKGAGF